ncbi:bifunctional phosphoribosyl-AMP cyclohydrolase/phosphoribosyl-ATP diphosphatase HisIE [Oligoflexus tunisiensis]|uniref:bifunctional phosphoribosyl-AMP cyclohydrolase/phosphoribosyl-ATP diphosphatase HisIE n=1 Tax=Oligoflexus tunisiensis TaxID=708132 RepID=UPI000AD5F38A|nr:bifunctional phosphoribosyl-AMP cyclohydrolase/phosphoribosyl-ATP diphosphatase HisIE [Oligoflexus tunisiensis]
MIDTKSIDWEKCAGLIPAIVQDVGDDSVLMLGYMSPDALQITIDTGLVTFYSRTRQELWTKGETSGHFLRLKNLVLDCDQDTLLVRVEPIGPTCHTGSDTCFGPKTPSVNFLNQLQSVVDHRYEERPAGSYTTRLFEDGIQRMAQKVGEEGVEVALAAMTPGNAELLSEAADLLYHLTVLLKGRGLQLADAVKVLKQRHGE